MATATQPTVEATIQAPEPTEAPQVTPTAAPTPEPTQAPIIQADKEDVKREIWRVFGTQVAVAVATAESGLQSDVINSIRCCIGVFQINLSSHAPQIPGATNDEKVAWLQDYRNNIAFAKQMYDTQGWTPWQAFTNGSYRRYL